MRSPEDFVGRHGAALGEALFAADPDPVLAVDREARILAANRAARSRLPGGPGALDARTLFDLAPSKPDHIRTLLSDALRSGGWVPGRLDIPAEDRTAQWHVNALCLERASGDPFILLRCRPVGREGSVFSELNRRIASANRHAANQQRLRLEVEESNRALEQFGSMLAHDMRAPLRQLRTLADILKQDHGDELSPEAAELIGIIQSRSVRLDSLVEALRQLTQSRFGALTRQRIRLGRALEQARDNLRTQLAESGATITCDELPTVNADFALITLVFQNILSNAIHYRHADRRPEIAVRYQAEARSFRIEDNGTGFDQSVATRLFEPFKRNSHVNADGSGLGLAICRTIVERHGWSIEASGCPGEGACFRIALTSKAFC